MNATIYKYRVFLAYAALAVLTLAGFCQVCRYEFVGFDDNRYVVENPHVREGLSLDGIVWAFTTTRAGNWHPLTWLSHMLDCELFGVNPNRHHLTNLVLHIANTLLLFTVLKRMTGTLWRSFFVAAAFSLHPLHVESVAWIAERKDVLSSFFWMLTMLAYHRYVEQVSVRRYVAAVLFFGLGLMAKPMLVTLPFVLVLLDYWPLGRFGRWGLWRLLREKAVFFVLSGVSCVVTFFVQHQAGATAPVAELSVTMRMANALVSYVKYIGRMFWPRGLVILYPHPVGRLAGWEAAVSAVVLLGVTVLVLCLAARYRYLPAGWLWYLGTLVPVIGLVQVGSQALADRYTYIPLIGLFIIIGWGSYELFSRWRNRRVISGVVMSAAIFGLLVCTVFQVRHWRNGISLFSHAVRFTDNNHIAHFNLAKAYIKAGRIDEAVIELKETVRIKRHWVPVNQLAWLLAVHNQSRFYDPEEAVRLARQACTLTDYRKPGPLNTLAAAYASSGRFNEAVAAAEKALELAILLDMKEVVPNIESNLKLYKAGKLPEQGGESP